jgi:hypothetical protein
MSYHPGLVDVNAKYNNSPQHQVNTSAESESSLLSIKLCHLEQPEQVLIRLLLIKLGLRRRRLSAIEIHPREPIHEICVTAGAVRRARCIAKHAHQVIHTTAGHGR